MRQVNSDQILYIEQDITMNQQSNSKQISSAVIKRLPRYYRYLRELIRNGVLRISSKELSEKMNVTASQIRQDLNCFGGFGQQGYGYNVKHLYSEISQILGTENGYTAIIVGVGNLGKALANNSLFEKRGVEITGLFDIDPSVIGTEVAGITVMDYEKIEDFLSESLADIAVLTVPKSQGFEVAERLAKIGIRGFWNFSNMELSLSDYDVKIENIHLGDTLMTLCYELSVQDKNEKI